MGATGLGEEETCTGPVSGPEMDLKALKCKASGEPLKAFTERGFYEPMIL